MSETKRIVSAAKTVLKTLNEGISAYNDFNKGKDAEGWKHVMSGISTLNDGWEDIKYSWQEINKLATKIMGNPTDRIKQTYANDFVNLLHFGVYTGFWNQNADIYHIDHNKDSHLSVLSAERKDGNGWNIYHGIFDTAHERFVWTGYNSQSLELLIIGSPQSDTLIFADVWMPSESGDLIFNGTTDLSRKIRRIGGA